jgi:hypothetical protein
MVSRQTSVVPASKFEVTEKQVLAGFGEGTPALWGWHQPKIPRRLLRFRQVPLASRKPGVAFGRAKWERFLGGRRGVPHVRISSFHSETQSGRVLQAIDNSVCHASFRGLQQRYDDNKVLFAERREVAAVHDEVDKYKFESAVDVYRALTRDRS